ncbi:MAG: PEP-CTERM sorting domain-containing protein [Gloeobacteraceae cyanobacterium ES-bin-144]|nr:PEP-CTERM sorting domain-containing protein [Verrucomicrobiales bacterium]
MKKPFLLTAFSVSYLLAGVPRVQAAVIFDDTTGFAGWYKGGSSGTLTKGSTLAWTENSTTSGYEVIGRSFVGSTIAIGETITLTFDWTQSSATVDIIRAGLYNIGGTLTADSWAGANGSTPGSIGTFEGYYSFLRDSGAGKEARIDSGNNTGNTNAPVILAGTNIGTNTTNVNLTDNGTVTYQVLFSVTRTSASQVATLFDIRSGLTSVLSVAGNQTTGTTFSTFDSAFIRSSGGTMTLDNIKLSVVPEPSQHILAAIGLASLAFRRRR